MDAILRAEVRKYYATPSLYMLLVISCMSKLPDFGWYFHRNDDAKILYGLSEKSRELDSNIFRLFRSRSRWNGLLSSMVHNSERSQDVFMDGDRYAQTALHVLKYLCRRRDYPYTLFRGPADSFRQTGHIINIARTRKRRVDKHQRGRLPLANDSEDFKPCKAGLKILPELLKRATRSNELRTFIHLHLLDIVVTRKWTRWAIYSISEYLKRAC